MTVDNGGNGENSEKDSESKEAETAGEGAETVEQPLDARVETAEQTVDALRAEIDAMKAQIVEENDQLEDSGTAAATATKAKGEVKEFGDFMNAQRKADAYGTKRLGDEEVLFTNDEKLSLMSIEAINEKTKELIAQSEATEMLTPEGKDIPEGKARREELRKDIERYMSELDKRRQTEESIGQEGPNWELLKSLRAFEGKLVKDGDRYGECLNKLQASIETGYDLTPRDIQEIGKILFANETNLDEQSFWKVMGSLQNIINADRDAENERKEAREKAIAESSENPAKEPRSAQARFFVDSEGEATEDLQQQIKEFARKMIDNSDSTEWATKEEEQFKINHAQEIEDELKEIAKEAKEKEKEPEEEEFAQIIALAQKMGSADEQTEYTSEEQQLQKDFKEILDNYKTAIDALQKMNKLYKVTDGWLKGICETQGNDANEKANRLAKILIAAKILGEPDEHGQMEILLKDENVQNLNKKKSKSWVRRKIEWALDPRNELNFITIKALRRNKKFGYFGDSSSAENSNEGNKQGSPSASEVSPPSSETNNTDTPDTGSNGAGDIADWLANPVASTRQTNIVDNDAGTVSEPPPRPTQPSVDMTPVEEKSKGKDGGVWSWLGKRNKPKPK